MLTCNPPYGVAPQIYRPSYKPKVGTYEINPNNSLAQGLVCLLMFDEEGVNPNPIDHATPRAVYACLSSGQKNVFRADRANYLLKMSDVGLPIGNTPRTISTWFRTQKNISGYGSYAGICAYGTNSPSNAVIIALGTDPNFGDRNFGPSQYGDAFGTNIVANTGHWINGVATFDGSIWQVFQNGFYSNQKVMSTNTISNGFFYVGVDGFSGGSGILGGDISDLKIWNRVLSTDEILQQTRGPYSMLRAK